MPHRDSSTRPLSDYVRTPWGYYYVDPWQIDEAKRRGEIWAKETIAEIRRALTKLTRAPQPPHKTRRDAQHDADLVVERGIATKNRFGTVEVAVPLPDGCYRLTRIDPPSRKKSGRGVANGKSGRRAMNGKVRRQRRRL